MTDLTHSNTFLVILLFLISVAILTFTQLSETIFEKFLSLTTQVSKTSQLQISAHKPISSNFPSINIPFFIYNSTEFQWIENCTKTPGNLVEPGRIPSLENHYFAQHGNDIRFTKQLSNHSWRVFDPNLADIFVIPVLLNYMTKLRSFKGHPVFFRTCNLQTGA